MKLLRLLPVALALGLGGIALAPAAVPAGPAPDFTLRSMDGRNLRLQEQRGRVVMLNFWATWCGPCRREIPLLNKVHAERAKQKVEIIGIAVDFRDDVLAYAGKTPISYPLLIGEEDGLAAVQAFGMQPNFPFTVFADSKQRLVALKIGELHQEEIDLILDRVLAVDAGSLDLPAAREQISEGLKQIATKRATEASKSPKLAAN
jgi:thiol-disulfide isomerase/thioredoxin